MYDKFNNLDYLEVFKSMLIIEDLNVQKTFNRKFSIKDKTVTKYHDLDTNSQNVFYNLLKTRLCPEKSNELLNKAYIIEVS